MSQHGIGGSKRQRYYEPLGMLGVSDGVTDNVLQENLEDTTGLLVDEAGNTLDTTTTSKTTDSLQHMATVRHNPSCHTRHEYSRAW